MILSPSLLLKKMFHHKPTFIEIWKARFEAFFVGAAIILFWRGIWNLADYFLFPEHPMESAFASLFI
jgi:Fuseless